MSVPALIEVAHHIDRMSRAVASARDGNNLPPRDLNVGWMSAEVVGDGGEYASNCQNRVQWIGLDGPATAGAVIEAIEAMKGLGKRRAFFRMGPQAWNAGTLSALEAVGAREVPWVRYPVLTRAAAGSLAEVRTGFTVRVVSAAEAGTLLQATAPWFSEAGIQTASQLIRTGEAELHAALEGHRPAAVGLLMMDADWGYLGFAGTAPDLRNRGGQSALIRSRIARARDLGAKWCSSETATAVETSLNNLVCAGFEEAFGIRVFGWSDDSSRPDT